MINNKKADLSIVVFVFLVILLCSYVLFVLASNRTKMEKKIIGYDLAEGWLLEQKDLEYRLTKIGEECLIESFGASGSTYIDEEYLMWIEERSDELLTDKIKLCLKEKAENSYDLLDKSQPDNLVKSGLFARLKNGTNLNVKSESGEINLILKEFPISWLNKENTYIVNLEAKIILNRIGLIHPQEFMGIVECKEDQTCIDKISKNLLDVQTKKEKINNSNYIRYEIKSNREFLFGNEFKKIDLTFLVKKTN